MRTLFYSLLSFIIAIFFVLIGIVSIMMLFSPAIRNDLVQFILENPVMIFLFGFCFLVTGIALLAYIWITAQKKHYTIKSKNHSIWVSEDVFQEYLNSYWKQLFPNHDIPNQVLFQKNKIHITADLPFVPIPEQKSIIQRIEQDLSELFNRYIGYRKEYLLSITFQPEHRPVRKK